MPTTIVLLEDAAERLARFHAVLRTAWPDMHVLTWRNAHRMIAECPPHLPTCALICLDHDLDPEPGNGADPDTGLNVARFLATANIPCPILIHSSNADGAHRMRGTLELAGCTVRTILPFGPNWIEHHWRLKVEEMTGVAHRADLGQNEAS